MISKISVILLGISEGGGQTRTEIAALAGLPQRQRSGAGNLTVAVWR